MSLSPQDRVKPLPSRVRPNSLNNYHGHHELVQELQKYISTKTPKSIIIQGPPASGKTTLAYLFMKSFDLPIVEINGVDFTVANLRAAVDVQPRNFFLFIDEIHRLNKANQDKLLAYVEKGKISLVAATTEPIGACINSALVSRVLVKRIERLTPIDMLYIICDAVNHPKGLSVELQANINITQNAMNRLCTAYNGDARAALIALHSSAIQKQTVDTQITIDAKDLLTENSYSTSDSLMSEFMSAMIKSIRGSSVDGAIYYCASMLELGQDPLYIARRLIISADEDIGIAYPMASTIAISCYNAVKTVGMPEARICLAKAIVVLASSPKDSSAYSAMNKALQTIKETGPLRPPKHIRPAGFETGEYHFPHDTGSYNSQSYLPPEISSIELYAPKSVPGIDVNYLFTE